jgi:excinuclease UvrABC nuclease subunit
MRGKTCNNVLDRRNLKAKIKAVRTRSEKASPNEEYQSKNEEVKRMIHNDKRKFIEQLEDTTQEAAKIGNTKKLSENRKPLSQKNWGKN